MGFQNPNLAGLKSPLFRLVLERNVGLLVKVILEWVSLGLKDDSSVLCSTREVRVMSLCASLADGALLDKTSRFPDVADDGLVDVGGVPLPSSSSLRLLLTDRALVEKATRFSAEHLTSKSSVLDGSMGGKSFSLTFSLSNDEGCSLGRIDSLISWRKKDGGIFEDIYKHLRMLSSDDVAMEAPENRPKVFKTATLE